MKFSLYNEKSVDQQLKYFLRNKKVQDIAYTRYHLKLKTHKPKDKWKWRVIN